LTSEIIVACAGSGKTQYIIDSALSISNEAVAIITYTEQNNNSIIRRVIKKCGSVPSRITIQTWFSFLIEHGIKPYLAKMTDRRITGLSYQNVTNLHIRKTELSYYFNKEMEVYKDRASDLVIQLNDKSNGGVINRMKLIFDHIYFDEAQDFSGYDYNLINLIQNNIDVTVVGDPRQRTFVTNNGQKNKSFTSIFEYFEKQGLTVDYLKLNTNHRSVSEIGNFSDLLYPEYPHTVCNLTTNSEHRGIFYVKENNIELYLRCIPNIVQLRDSCKTKCSATSPVSNFGESKGLEYDHVLIYPTKRILEWLKDYKSDLPEKSRCKLYVAITRAKYSVAFVIPEGNNNFTFWSPDQHSIT